MCVICERYERLTHVAVSNLIIKELTDKLKRMRKVRDNYTYLASRKPIVLEKDSEYGLITIDNRKKLEELEKYVSFLSIHLREVKRFHEMANN